LIYILSSVDGKEEEVIAKEILSPLKPVIRDQTFTPFLIINHVVAVIANGHDRHVIIRTFDVYNLLGKASTIGSTYTSTEVLAEKYKGCLEMSPSDSAETTSNQALKNNHTINKAINQKLFLKKYFIIHSVKKLKI
jgi:hypothetical protein